MLDIYSTLIKLQETYILALQSVCRNRFIQKLLMFRRQDMLTLTNCSADDHT